MNNEEIKAFKTKIYTLISILAVLVFLVYIMGFVFIQSGPFKPTKVSDIEVVKIVKGDVPDTWKVIMNFASGEERVVAAMYIHKGKVVSGFDDSSSPGVKNKEVLGE